MNDNVQLNGSKVPPSQPQPPIHPRQLSGWGTTAEGYGGPGQTGIVHRGDCAWEQVCHLDAQSLMQIINIIRGMCYQGNVTQHPQNEKWRVLWHILTIDYFMDLIKYPALYLQIQQTNWNLSFDGVLMSALDSSDLHLHTKNSSFKHPIIRFRKLSIFRCFLSGGVGKAFPL